MTMGPTLLTTTMVFGLTAATALTRAFPLCHASRSFRSPAFPSTGTNPSPLSAVTKTIAALRPSAALAAGPVLSLIEDVMFVLSIAERLVRASNGWFQRMRSWDRLERFRLTVIKYGKLAELWKKKLSLEIWMFRDLLTHFPIPLPKRPYCTFEDYSCE